MAEFLIAVLSVFKEALMCEYFGLSDGNMRCLFFMDLASCHGVMYKDSFTFEKETTILSCNFGHQSLSDAGPHLRRTKTSNANAFGFG
jgi:hypothetical protein